MGHEIIKTIAAIAWPVGLIFLFLVPPLGIIVLLVAIMLTIESVNRTRAKRHQELLDAARGSQAPQQLDDDGAGGGD